MQLLHVSCSYVGLYLLLYTSCAVTVILSHTTHAGCGFGTSQSTTILLAILSLEKGLHLHCSHPAGFWRCYSDGSVSEYGLNPYWRVQCVSTCTVRKAQVQLISFLSRLVHREAVHLCAVGCCLLIVYSMVYLTRLFCH